MVARVRGRTVAAVAVVVIVGVAILGWRLRDGEPGPGGAGGSALMSGGSAISAGSAQGSAVAPGRGSAAAPTGAINPVEQLIASARIAAADGNLTKARDLLDRAYALDPQPTTLLEIARLDHQIGRCRDARRAAGRVLEAAPTGPLAAAARDLLGQIGHCD